MTGRTAAVLGAGSWGTALAVHLARLRKPLAELGLRLRARRSRGYLLEIAPDERRRSPTREPP